ncbi:MAG TPA: NAD+ synthase [Bacteroidota bacterium]|nr:NAD+ synthase [Bacteroidota bacterium]
METPHGDHQGSLKLNMELVEELLVQFLADETRSAGFERGVIGVSGGVDSAVSAYLTAKALGKQNTWGIILPYKTSNPESLKDAEKVVKELGIRTETIDISPMVDAYCDRFGVTDHIRRGNVMARVRMIILYDISAREHALVIGTSNKTELLVGYGTLYGDTACAINPIGDLYKTQVWQLAAALGVPQNIIDKKPTADLWPGQTDEAELGVSYRDLDALLYQMIDERRNDEELQRLGFAPDFIRKVRGLVQKNQFKRRPPIIAKVSYRTLNVDFRYVRDWGV